MTKLISCRRTAIAWAFSPIVFCPLAVISALFFGVGCNANHLYSEGGSFPVLSSDNSPPIPNDPSTFDSPADLLDNELQQPNQQYQTEFAPSMEQMVDEQRRNRLAKIIEQMRDNGQFSQQEIADGPGLFLEEGEANVPIERPSETETYWDGLKEKILVNWSKIKRRIEKMLSEGKKLREILNEKCKENEKLWEKLWEAFVEETNELRQLVDEKPTVHWKNQLVDEYGIYRKLCSVAKKALKTFGDTDKRVALESDRSKLRLILLAMKRVEETEQKLGQVLADGASGESNEMTKKHKRGWLERVNDAVESHEKATDEFYRVYTKTLGELESSEMFGENEGKKIAAVKKGQNEFVEFVEPRQHQNNRHKEWMDKRVPTDSDRKTHAFYFLTNSGNILFMAYLAVCCFGIVAGAVGGVYYYNHVRSSRIDDPFNEFTRYSPAGPTKDKLKKSGSPIFGQSGDDTLAYKAQLHHYQQQKQKILGTASGPVVDNVSDNEEDTDEMDHNYSVFECPGLAPTGDLEIQNPNFVGAEKSTAGETRRTE
ncbi:hypothetical protein niasHT_006744 [Heterodera trifolii]|uniref:Uncharacterized protein n=1 Tax=Heterodera trifolii TaxID=157864 RepID=A0ABD2LWP1_9BILA